MGKQTIAQIAQRTKLPSDGQKKDIAQFQGERQNMYMKIRHRAVSRRTPKYVHEDYILYGGNHI